MCVRTTAERTTLGWVTFKDFLLFLSFSLKKNSSCLVGYIVGMYDEDRIYCLETRLNE
jgi:hypothetical protein